MKNTFLLISILLMSFSGFAQVKTDWRDGSETIFSWGNVDNGSLDAENVVRFSAFLNQQMQFHVDYGKNVGFYTGLGIRNIGFIHKFGDTLKIKQRVYSIGIPVAIKIGNLEKNVFVAIGSEMELFFHFKEKTFLHGEKFKNSEWFSNRTELFHPSVFAEIGLGQGFFVRYRYYLTDFMRKQSVIYPGGIQIPYNNSPSPLMYISIGTMFSKKKIKEKMPEIKKTSNTMASGENFEPYTLINLR